MMAPSNKAISIMIITLAFVIFVIVGFGIEKSSDLVGSSDNLIAGEKILPPTNPNWQEDLDKLNIQNKDLSGTEVIPNRDTVTEALSITLASNILTHKQNNTLTERTALDLIDKSLDFVDSTAPKTDSFKVSDLNVVPNNGQISIKQYGENLGLILKTSRPVNAKNEMQIIGDALQTNNPSKMNELDPVIMNYQNLNEKLVKMPVPQLFVEAHLDMVNGLNQIPSSLKEVKKVFADPMTGLMSLELYNGGVSLFASAISATVDFIKSNKVIYEQGSGGYFLLYGI